MLFNKFTIPAPSLVLNYMYFSQSQYRLCLQVCALQYVWELLDEKKKIQCTFISFCLTYCTLFKKLSSLFLTGKWAWLKHRLLKLCKCYMVHVAVITVQSVKCAKEQLVLCDLACLLKFSLWFVSYSFL